MTNPAPPGQVPESLIDLIDAYAETRHRYGRIHNARTEAARKAVIEALSGVQALSAAPAGPWSLGEMTGNWRDIDLPDHGGVMRVVWRMEEDDGKANPQLEAQAHAVVAALNAASSTPPADQQAAQVIINFPQVGTAGPFPVVDGRVSLPDCTMQDLVRMLRPTYEAEQQAASKAAPVTQQAGYAEVIECGNSYAKVKLKGEAFGSTKVGDIFYTAPQPSTTAQAADSGFDYKTATDFLSGKTVSDEALRKFVAASRGAHDARAALHAKMLSLQGELASREAEIALLKRSLLDAEAAPQQEVQEPAAFIHWPINGPPRLVWYSQKALNDAILKTHEDGYKPDVKLYTAPQPAPAPLSEVPYEKRKAIQEGEQIGASDAWFKARHEMLDTVDRRNVFRAGFDRGWSAALAAQGGK